MRDGRNRAASAVMLLSLGACGPSSQHAGLAAPSPEALMLVAELPAAYHAANLDNGRLHLELCRSCHVVTKDGSDSVGPNLFGVFGRKVASRPGYTYSAALRAQRFSWDAAHLDGWLTKPRAYIPGTKMSFVGLKDDGDRRDLIAYLKVVSSGGPP